MSVAYKLEKTENSEQNEVQNSVLPLYAGAFAAAFCGIAYQLLLASYASFLLGASILQYSLILSLMMASMGVGSLLTDRVKGHPAEALVLIESLLALVAATALPFLYYCFASDLFPQVVILGFVILIGTGLGMEIPLLNRLSRNSDGLSTILFWDYAGGFIGGIAFPLFLVPQLGFFQIAGILSLLNAFTGVVVLAAFRKEADSSRLWWLLGLTIVAGSTYLFFAETIRMSMETQLFGIVQ